MNLLQPVKFPPILIFEFQGSPPACTLHKDHYMATANKNINENIVAVEDIIPRLKMALVIQSPDSVFKERYSLKQVHTKQRGRRADLHMILIYKNLGTRF